MPTISPDNPVLLNDESTSMWRVTCGLGYMLLKSKNPVPQIMINLNYLII